MLHLTPTEKAFAAFRRKASDALKDLLALRMLTPHARDRMGAFYEQRAVAALEEAFHEWVEGGSLGRID